MSSPSRDGSRDRADSRMVKHSHSFSESGRASVPMWDSSDPDRAPPPLPLNPVAGSPITRPHVSSTIEKAAALIASRAIENTPSAYTSNPPPSSPDRNLIKPHHRRMQSVQTGTVGRISDSLERRSPDKGLSRSKLSDQDDYRTSRSLDRSPVRSGAETPTPSGRDTPTEKSFLDENTPSSTSMLALQSIRNRQDAEMPFNDITNGQSPLRSTMSLESLSSQILNITTIATSLQREMTNLSRRSKDNATDLNSLREATSTRDEDIRKSLRDLVASFDSKFTSIDSRMLGSAEASRSTPNLGLYLDEKVHDTPTRKNFTLPRMTSPSFLDRDFTASPSVVSVDGAASIALLEKVLREMATKDGVDKVMNTLENAKLHAQSKNTQALIHDQEPVVYPSMMQKIEEILLFMKEMKEDSGSKALVKAFHGEGSRTPSQIDLYLDADGKAGAVNKLKRDEDRRSSNISSNGSEFVSDEMMKILKSVKQSLSQNGGLTNEVKTLLRELRGEVLGMGREIAKKLEDAVAKASTSEQDESATSSEEIARIVEQGLAEMKEHMHHIVRENRRQSTESIRPAVDTQEVVIAVKNAMAEMPRANPEVPRDFASEREELLSAVREAWEDCKPEIALEHFGLERDEILETLKEGLESYQPQQPAAVQNGISYEQVLDAVQRGLADFKAPEIQTEAGATREEIFATIKECLDNYDFPAPAPPSQLSGSELTRDDVLDAVKEVLSLQVGHPRAAELTREDVAEAVRDGVAAQGQVAKEVEFNREDLFDAIKACLEGDQNPLGGMGERVVEAMHEFLSSMKVEFQQYSAANGRDTEQVLDALKDGLEDLRADVESYVDRAADVTGKDEIIDAVKAGFAAMQIDMDKGFSSRMQQALNTPELLDAMEKEFEHLRDSISKSLNQNSMTSDKNEILDAIRDIGEERESTVSSGNNSEDIMRLVKDELEHMRTTLATTLIKSGSSLDRDEVLDTIREGIELNRSMPKADGNESVLSNTSELLDAFQEGVDGLRADMQKLVDKPSDLNATYEILDTLKVGIEDVRADIQKLHDKQSEASEIDDSARGREITLHEGPSIQSEIESLKVMITQLRVQVESLDIASAPEPLVPVIPTEMRVHKDDLDELHSAIREVHESIQTSTREVQESVQTSTREVHESVQNSAKEVHESVQSSTREMPEVPLPLNAASKEDVEAIETLLRNVKAQLDDLVLPDLTDNAKVSHIDSIEGLLRDVKSAVEASTEKPNDSTNKEDFTIIELLLKDVQTSIEDLPSKVGGGSEDETKLTKTDLEVLESICLDTKEKLEGFSIPDIEYLANKEDMVEIKDSIKAFREQLEADNDLTAQAFEARKIEHGGLATKIDDVKALMSEVREELIGKLNGSEEGLVELAKVLGMHHDSMSDYATASSVEELLALVSKNFDSHMDYHATGKTEMEERDATLFSKHEETSVELKAKIEERFNELMIKYDDAQVANEAKLAAMAESDQTHLEATAGVKIIIDDLKNLIDTLGSTLSETCERLSDDSKTVFERVEENSIKLGDLQGSNSQEHTLTREEVAKTLAATTRLEGSLQEHQPAILAAVQEVLGIVGQHFEHSRQQDETIKAATEEIKSNVSAIPSAIPALLPAIEAPKEPPPVVEVPIQKEYDDTEVHSKLDELLGHADSAKSTLMSIDDFHKGTREVLSSMDNFHKDTREALSSMDDHHRTTQAALMSIEDQHKLTQESLVGLEKLDSIHEQVRTAAEEISVLVATQTRLASEHHESKAEEAREAAIALEKRTAQKERVEADIIALTQEKDALAASMAALRREHEELTGQTKKLAREVGKLETALSVRQEEMREMNSRAELLERRVLEGVMNHARAVKFAKPPTKKRVSPGERDAAMSLKRVASTTSNATAKASSNRNDGSTFGHAVGMALKKRNGLPNAPNPAKSTRASNVDRRILSTSNVTGNRPSDAHRALVLAPAPNTGLVSLKRSHSVKSNPSSYLSGRKPSWNGPESYVSEKENQSVDDEEAAGDDLSDVDTERRTSYTGTYTDSMLYGTGSSLSQNSMRSTSYASSAGGTHNGHGDSILEEDEDEEDAYSVDEETHHQNGALTLAQAPNTAEGLEELDEVGDLPAHLEFHKHEAKYAAPSDSGIGSEPPTPDVSQNGSQAWRSTVSTG